MADRIKGITVEIGGDTTKLSSALKGVNSQLKSTQAALKDVDKQLKLDPTNTELLRQKQKLLADSIKETKDKLKQLKDAEEQLKKAGVDENSEQFLALRREIIETERNLKDLEKQARNSNATMAKIGAVSKEIANGAKSVAQETRALSAAAGAALVGIGTIGIKAAQAADDLNTLAKQTGLSTEMLQKAQYAADLIDVSFETFTASIGKMESKLRTSEESFTNLGISTRDVSGNLLSTEEIFKNSAEALSLIGNETERDIAAQTLFGRSASELAGILDDGGAALEEYGNQAKNMGLIMDQDTLNSLNEVNDKLDEMKAKLKGTLAKAGAKALDALKPALDSVSKALESILKWIGNLSPSAIKFLSITLAVVAAISPIASIVAGIAIAVAVLASPIGIIIAAITAVIALTAVIVIKWKSIKAFFKETWTAISGFFKNAAKNMGDQMRGLADRVRTNFKTAVDAVKGAFAGLLDKVRSVMNNVKNIFQNTKDTIKRFVDSIKGFFSNLHLELPHIKLPHFKITGGKAPWGLGGQGEKPSIGIDWYAKAMNNAMILKNPTIFGAMNGNLLGGGEAGAEVVSGANTLMNMIRSAVAEEVNNSASISLLQVIANNTGASTSVSINNREFGRLVKAVI